MLQVSPCEDRELNNVVDWLDHIDRGTSAGMKGPGKEDATSVLGDGGDAAFHKDDKDTPEDVERRFASGKADQIAGFVAGRAHVAAADRD